MSDTEALSSSKKQQIVYSLQYIRFLAASLVVMTHTFQSVGKSGRGDIGSSFNLGNAGVDLFFVISGFIMLFITRSREPSAGRFLWQRFARIVPPYWLATFVMALGVMVLPGAFNSSKIDTLNFLASFLMLAWPHPTWHDAVPLFFPGWTLNYEVFFYVVFACSMKIDFNRRAALSTALLLIFVLLGLWNSVGSNISISFYTRPIMLEFVYGMALAWFASRERAASFSSSVLLLLAAPMLLCLSEVVHPMTRSDPSRCIFWGLPALMFVAGGLGLEQRGFLRKSTLFRLFGDASYATYLSHFFVVGACAQFWRAVHLRNHLSDIYFVVLCLTLSWCVGVLFHLWFELPVVSWLKLFTTSSPSRSATRST